MINTLNRITEHNKELGIVDVTVSADSINELGNRITTFILHRFPKGACQAELNKHRTIANNSFSSRAVNKSKYIENIKNDPYIPIWTYNKPGMIGDVVEDVKYIKHLTNQYLKKMEYDVAYVHNNYDDIHKQDTNTQLDHYARIPIIVTSTNWEYFFNLRTADGVKPEFRRIAMIAQELYNNNTPTETNWHIPWIKPDEQHLSVEDKCIMCAARSAWLSYANHLGEQSLERAQKLVSRLIADKHYSTLDHAAISEPNRVGGIYTGWTEHRQLILT
jgi:hypothetical protein